MKTLKNVAAAVLAVTLLGSLPAAAQDKAPKSVGGYHGELDFPISWKRYYSYDEVVKLIHDMQKQYSRLADIGSIGTSRMGRDQFVLTITNKATGAPESKTALWADGAIHGNEVNGVTCTLYLAWYLLSRYDYDPYIHGLVDSYTFYILPGLNVDANDSFVRFPNTPNNPREPYRPEDNDGDGLYDEDQTEDVDGDGELSTMYVEDASGNLKLSPDGRRFIPVTDDTEQVLRFRRVGSEGYDNDGDGRINEDDIGGPDPNRTFPYDWNLRDGWPYTLSEPETRNVYEFWRNHPNIFASFHYHNTGRLIMFSAPPAAPASEAQATGRGGGGGGFRGMTPEQRLEQMREENKYAQYFDRQVPREYQHDMDVQTEMVTMGARLLKNYRPTMSGLVGQAQAASYYMLGQYAYLIELWGTPDFESDTNGDGRVSDEETLAWIDLELQGEGWVTPHKVNHPDLGAVWIGGTQKKHTVRTPPPRYMESEALRNTQFALYVASQFPKVSIGEVNVSPAGGDLYWVDVEVRNDRTYPTSSDREVVLETAVLDRLTLKTASGVKILPVPEGTVQLDPYDRSSAAQAAAGDVTEMRLEGKSSRRLRYLVQGARGAWVEAQIVSKFGGTATKRVELRPGG